MADVIEFGEPAWLVYARLSRPEGLERLYDSLIAGASAQEAPVQLVVRDDGHEWVVARADSEEDARGLAVGWPSYVPQIEDAQGAIAWQVEVVRGIWRIDPAQRIQDEIVDMLVEVPLEKLQMIRDYVKGLLGD